MNGNSGVDISSVRSKRTREVVSISFFLSFFFFFSLSLSLFFFFFFFFFFFLINDITIGNTTELTKAETNGGAGGAGQPKVQRERLTDRLVG